MEMRVSAKTHPKSLGGAIFKAIKDHGEVTLISIGGGAVNACNKALIVASNHFKHAKLNVSFEPAFTETNVPDKGTIVAVSWIVKKL
ncbi:stage V sporulation protein S [Neobacillus sp. YIM B02564]|uniref:Stage V sporulation protein S n=1 Tax=Neobacillus paridis TaxID=2803862 RepID=A0ABS1TLW8_9BACI|nr:stage V sporulation protein S [Neobacillus paridis]MBL4952173.1 stage V sporulation protein S [Neobacillus paridis]